MAPSSLVSLRGFRSGVDLPGPDPLRTASSHPIHPSLAHPATSSQWRGLNPHARTFVATRHLPPAAAAIAAVGGRSVQVSRRPLATVAMAEAAQPQPDAVQVGRLVEFSRGKSQSLGLVVAPTTPAGTWKVEDVSGTVHAVREKHMAYVLPGGAFSAAELQIIAAEASRKEDDCLKEALMALTWEVSEPGAMYTVPDMAELLFTSTSPAACSAAHRLLAGDRLYFKQIGRTPPIYVARHRGEVDSLKRQAELKRAAEERTQQAVDALTSAAAKPRAQRPTQAEWLAGPQAGLVASLETYALGRQPVAGDAGHASALEVLAAMGAERTPQGATSLLQSVGYWPLHVQLSLLSSGLTERFTPELEAQAAAVAAQPPPDLDADRRTDLRDLAVYTIDDATTTEIDDGLSAERLPGGGVRVWVHVADPTRWVRFGDPLDIEARRRSKTLYLPTGMVPMFPLTLATGPFSLRAGEESCALSVCCVVGEDGEILPGSIEIGPSTITPTHRLTYEVVDEMLDVCTEAEEPALHALATAAEARRRYRTALGAVEIAMPEPEIVVRNEAEESPEVVVAAGPAEASASKQLVAEMMILAGEVCARLGAAKGVPLPYRSQPDPVLPSDEELEAVPPGPCRMVLLRSCMPRSVTTAMDPQRHAGLGLDAYAQVTSPIRRYGDLLAHWQLKAVLRGEEPPLGAAQMSDLLSELGNTTQRVSRLERDAQSYWVALYFKHAVEADPEAVWSATFMGWFKQEAGLARVLLDDMGLETLVKVVGAALPGAALKVRCTSADPLMGVFRLEEMVRQRAGRAMEG